MAAVVEIQLPEKVDEQLRAICVEKSVSSANVTARKLLLEVGEQESLKILKVIHNTTSDVYSLSGYIIHLVKKSRNCPSPLSPLSSPHVPHSNSPPQGSIIDEKKRKRESECSARRECYFGPPTPAPTLVEEAVPDPTKSTPSPILIEVAVPDLPKSGSDLVLDELEKLEFRKAFLILNYTGGAKLENVVSAEQIRSYQSLAMREFEIQIWNDFGRGHCGEKGRIKIVNWTTAERYYYHCHVDTKGNFCFKGPFLNKAATLLQKTVGDENVLLVKFMEQEKENIGTDSIRQSPVFNMVIEDGIFVGRKCYRFFVYKDGGKEIKRKDPNSSPIKCYFVCFEGFATLLRRPPHLLKGMSVQEARRIFMHIHKAPSLSIYMARFSLILSKTITLGLNFNDVHVEVIEDEPCRDEDGEIVYGKDKKPMILTDGTGFISEDLALRCPHNCYNGYVNNEENVQELQKSSLEAFHFPLKFSESSDFKSLLGVPPLLIQFRMFHKGRAIKGTVLVNRKEALTKPLAVLYRTKAAVRVAVNWDFTDEYISARMVASGIPLDEPFLQHCLSEIAKEEMKSLKGGKLPVSDSYYLMGTADPTGTLNSGEVCVIMDQGQLSGPVLVYRNPGLHPGDIHVVNAKYVESLKDFVGNSKYGIFFPAKGPRSMADEIAGGDYDGDMYWVSTNSELLNYFRPREPWTSKSCLNASNKTDLLEDEALEQRLFRSFLNTRFKPDYAMGTAADSWLVCMDRLLTLGDNSINEKADLMQKIDELIDLYYDALDAPKKGNKVEIGKHLIPMKFPHHMGKGEHRTYKSKSILGEIHDIVDQLSAPIKFWKLDCFEAEVPEMCLNSWGNYYSNYRLEMKGALDNSKSTDAVYEKYRKMLYGGVDDLDSSEKPWKEIRLEAIAIYHVCYDYAEMKGDPKKCGFAWKVAGDALWKIYLQSKGEKPIWFAPSVVRRMMR